ncbi:galanin receptor type 1-like [Ptychodera flava]|uniref:galanin receptor type 1-like n=1 Tax=Ptychodera flava TaxID=63121 RepID=UPI00396A93F5
MTERNASLGIPVPNYPLAITFSILDFLTIAGNGFNIIAISRIPELRTHTGMCLLALAITELIFGIFFMPNAIVLSIMGEWLLGDPLCKFEAFGSSIFFLTSLCILATMSMERYIRISRPLRHKILLTKNRLMTALVVSFLYSVIMMLPSLAIPKYLTVVNYCCSLHLSADSSGIYTICLHLIGYLLPLSIIVFAYLGIFRIARKAQKTLPGNMELPKKRTRAANIKIARQILAVIGTFMFCCTPIVCVTFVSMVTNVPWYIMTASQVIVVSNNAINPFIYISITKPLKQKVLVLCRECCKCCRSNSQQLIP